MEIVINLPDAIEGDYEIDVEKGVIKIRPKFFKGKGRQILLYCQANNPHGVVRASTLEVSAKDGSFVAINRQAVTYVEPEFDKVKSNAKPGKNQAVSADGGAAAAVANASRPAAGPAS